MKVDKTLLRILAAIVLGIAALSVFQERIGIRIDGNTVTLIGLAIVLLILPEISNLSKFKFANIEIEFQKKMSQLEKDVAMAESNSPKSTTVLKEAHDPFRKQYISDYNEIIRSSSSNSEKIMRASQLSETIMRERTDNAHSTLFREFHETANQILQSGEAISDELTSRVMSLLWRLVKMAA